MKRNTSSTKILLSFLVFLGGAFIASAQDCTNCFDEGPNGPECGKQGYYDADGDGFGTGVLTCFFPSNNYANWAKFGGDCNDNNANIYPRTFYLDSDGDGYGIMFGTTFCQGSSTPPSGYADNNDDCDDGNAAYTIERNWYADGDGDGVGLTSTQYFGCTPPGSMTNPVTIGGDLDDNNAAITNIPPSTFYYDGDGDGFGNDNITQYRSEPSTSYVSMGGDCNDSNNAIHPNTVWYLDIDGDGLGINSPQGNIVQCTMPSGNTYALVAGDVCPSAYGPIGNNGCPPNDYTVEPWNSIITITYNVAGEGTSKSKVYSNNLAKQVQSQSLDVKTNKVWASETIYDDHGRPSIQTMSAPVNSLGFLFHIDDFLKKTDGSAYTSQDFENNTTNPPVAGEQANSVGWYYSEQNTDEAYQDITDYPFAATEYSTLNPGQPLKMVGGNKINGQWPQSYTFGMPASQELSQSVAFGDAAYNSIKTVKTVVRDVHGNENVVFSDTDGKSLAAARSGGGTARAMNIAIGDQGFVDIHVPQGSGMGFTVTTNGNAVTTYNLITEATVSPSTSLANGFYRVSVNNLADYDPIGSPVTVNYKENYYDYSLNEYDDSGRLIASYQPLGTTKATKPKTTYQYNTLGQLVYTKSPDEGEAWFKYRKDGQIRYSQNSVQKDANTFSYTNYDSFGRPIESGVVANSGFTTANPDGAMVSGTKTERQYTEYDQTAQIYSLGSRQANYPALGFAAGNVAYTANDYSETWYNYDIYGRVKWLVQEILGLGTKTVDYQYDPVTGLVSQVIYQKGVTSEQFYHRYTYNVLSQLTKVETSTDGSAYTTQAEYTYYESGALKRTELAGGVQGVDYVYNLGGQLKSINHPSLSASDDPGGDGNDLFGMQVDYNRNDYLRSSASNMFTPGYGVDQLNGNIKGIRWNNAAFTVTGKQSTYAFAYDRNNWLTEADYGQVYNASGSLQTNVTNSTVYGSGSSTTLEAGNSITLQNGFHAQSGSTFTARIIGALNEVGNGDYDVTNITYDANGNIKTLKRNKDASGGNAMDNLTYTYKSTPQDGPNQLLRVDDAAGDVAGADDIADQSGNNYIYNKIGQLVENVQEGIKYYYNTNGLVTEVRKNNVTMVKFYYNDRNHRVRKETYSGGSPVANTYYVRDVTGSVMAIYSGSTLQEQPIYGNQRIAVYNRPGNVATYQLTDHLGNVRAIFQKSGSTTTSENHNDYYPFGMLMPQRNSIDANNYRYAYQGQEKDPETGKEAFELRLWDARIGRWLTTDPAGQYVSPYLGIGNNPIGLMDSDGGFAEPPTDYVNINTGEKLGTIDDGKTGTLYVTDQQYSNLRTAFDNADIDWYWQQIGNLLGPGVDHYNESVTWTEFVQINEGKSFSELANERPAGRIITERGGPNLEYRYVLDPVVKNRVIDMRHALIIGSYGQLNGWLTEIGQGFLGYWDSAFQNQDFYSNRVGEGFFDIIKNEALKLEGVERGLYMHNALNNDNFIKNYNIYLTNPNRQ